MNRQTAPRVFDPYRDTLPQTRAGDGAAGRIWKACARQLGRSCLFGREIRPLNAWIAALAALSFGIPAVSALLVLGSTGLEISSLSQLQEAAGAMVMMSMLAAVFGLLPALIIAAPLYALLASHAGASFLSVLLVAAVPGLGALLLDVGFGSLFLLYGLPIGLLTHTFALALQAEDEREPGAGSRCRG